MMLGIEPTTFGTWDSSRNHLNRVLVPNDNGQISRKIKKMRPGMDHLKKQKTAFWCRPTTTTSSSTRPSSPTTTLSTSRATSNVAPFQCDQIGRHFVILKKFQQSLAILRFYFSFVKILNLLWVIFYVFGRISFLWIAKYWINNTAICGQSYKALYNRNLRL